MTEAEGEQRQTEPGRPGVEEGPGRIEAFSDAVFAVILTIMALELHPPDGLTWDAIRATFPGLLVYALSFAFIGTYWNNHHHLLRAAHRINGLVMWTNLFLLFWLSLIPVLTAWIREDVHAWEPVAAYSVIALLSALAYGQLVRALIRANGRDSMVARAVGRDLKGKVSFAAYAAAVALAPLTGEPYASYALLVGVEVLWVIPDRRFTRPA